MQLQQAVFRIFSIFGLLLIVFGSAARAGGHVVVIVNINNDYEVSREDVGSFYTGRMKGWPDGSPVFLLDQDETTEARELFYHDYVGKSIATMRALWAQNIFAGKGLPPKLASQDADMKELVASNKHAIGYILVSEMDDTVKVLFP